MRARTAVTTGAPVDPRWAVGALPKYIPRVRARPSRALIEVDDLRFIYPGATGATVRGLGFTVGLAGQVALLALLLRHFSRVLHR